MGEQGFDEKRSFKLRDMTCIVTLQVFITGSYSGRGAVYRT